MIIGVQGLSLDINPIGNVLKYKVIDQSPEVTEMLRNGITDDETGFKIKSNNFPSYVRDSATFYLRGQRQDRNDREVRAEFQNNEECREAMFALIDLVNRIQDPAPREPDHRGSTTALRMSIMTRSQAQKLSLTDKNSYNPNRRPWVQADPLRLQLPNGQRYVANPDHYNEHIGQGIDVLNKSLGQVPPEYVDGVINPHKVSSDDARFAIALKQEMYDRAEQRGTGALVALWRLDSAMRAPDFVDDNEEENNEEI